MSETIKVGISDMKVARAPDVLVTFALGSCVGICLYDPVLRVGGLGHIMLPDSSPESLEINSMKYADTCIPLMLEQMRRMGCGTSRMTAKIAGGAKMFSVTGDNAFGNIGERNVLAVKKTLSSLRLRLVAEDTGLDYGRTVYFHPDSGLVEIKSFSKGIKML